MTKRIILILTGLLLLSLLVIYISAWETEEKFSTCKITGLSNLDTVNFRNHKEVELAASTLYRGSDLKKLIQGNQYRDAWATPIKVPILFLDTLKGKSTIIEEGGGKQTHSLKLVTKDGVIMTLRSVTKDPEKLVPEIADQLGLENIVIDGISAQHPYASLVVAELSNYAKVLHTQPHLYFVPKQESLGSYNKKYGNRLFMLEYETKGKKNWSSIKNVKEIIDTDGLQRLKLKYGEKLTVDQPLLVRSRLFDILIGDWDRHAKQWGWIVEETNDNLIAHPLPSDRDNAFFRLEGIVPTIITSSNTLSEVQTYNADVESIEGLIMPFDRYFLKEIPSSVFAAQAVFLQQQLTEKVIRKSFKVWPESIYNLDAERIIEYLLSRLKNLSTYAEEFKTQLDKQPRLTEPLKGSDDKSLQGSIMECFSC
ncbi:hypothetical protein HX109_08120 [Galbibacter sp. BG1]|uniref:hypothetical protein n=1 Tax=Galbibacter sp. BG1 TaxID=1170699 RepID=UPI0015BDEAD4|nr:hypothetical protein [Galbibacter sp. BG1]QLE01531.1 hypothetical protein HX109_08120 [Galbibacter sp. BG1]